MTAEAQLRDLKQRLLDVYDLNGINALLSWDQTTYMPKDGVIARARHNALTSRLAHEWFTDPALGRLLDALQPYAESLPYDSDDASLIRVTRREYDRAVRIPSVFVAELQSQYALSYGAWLEARAANNFNLVRPHLERTLDLSRRLAEFFPSHAHLADPLIEYSDYGMTSANLRALFKRLREQMVPLVKAILAQPPLDERCLLQHFPADKQLAYSEDVARRIGYDFERGRQDLSAHPFMTRFSLHDIRITTRVKEADFREATFSTIHECGHAMYEQGIAMAYEGTPLAAGTSAGVHESQSRLWENIVGRSREFWEYFYPHLQTAFAGQLGDVSLDTFHRAINKVERSLIRTDADEVTYNLHVMIRFDFELSLLEGSLSVRDLPEAWHARYEEDLGLAPRDDKMGVMQDSHWYSGPIGGAFQGYTLGNIMSAQFYEAALKQHPTIPDEMRHGRFDTLHQWLKSNIYQHGSKFTAPELLQRATGQDLTIEPYLRYLRQKYSALYAL